MNLFDRAIAAVSPEAAVRRAQARQVLARYEGGIPTRERRTFYPETSGDTEVQRDGRTLRGRARDLERNHDIARGAISILTRNIIGADGIGVEPRPRKANGDVDLDLADQLLTLWYDWIKRPEVRWTHDWTAAQQLMCRTWLRDGEALTQLLPGSINTLDHGTRVPFSIELLEPDLLPLEYNDPAQHIRQGIERNTWGRVRAYHIYKGHPGDVWRTVETLYPQLKRVDAQRMLHPFMTDRLSQVRGVSVFASVMDRLADIKDYETSERIAAKVAASMAAFIRKGTPDMYDEDGTTPADKRQMRFAAGMIFDDLAPGEEIGTINSTRPNPELTPFRRGQLQAASRGLEVGNSSMSGSYDGSYAAQRQELVEQWGAYRALSNRFIAQYNRPVWEGFVNAAVASGQLKLPRDIDPLHVTAAEFRPPPMPWIDPVKEANALKILKDENLDSLPAIIRARGGDYREVLRQQRDARRLAESYDVPFGAPAANQPAPPAKPNEGKNNANPVKK
ncbi:MAG: phage portal protein [Salinisphaera sp.]|nr:phage portal protein [Salinisphaera sp.]